MTNEETAVVQATDMFSLMDRLDDRAMVAAVEGRVGKAWIYSFPQGNTTVDGLSAEGVEEAARYLAKQSKGTDVIREIESHIESETETEARFSATAGRYTIIVNEETGVVSEALLDTAVRGKRVEKIYRNGALNPHWYEHGKTKAARNAKRALLPEELVATIIVQAKQLGRSETVRQPTAAAPSRPAAALPDDDGAPPPEEPAEAAHTPPNNMITQPQMRKIRSMLPRDEREQVELVEPLQPKAIDGTKVSLGGLTKAEGSELINKLGA